MHADQKFNFSEKLNFLECVFTARARGIFTALPLLHLQDSGAEAFLASFREAIETALNETVDEWNTGAGG